MSNILYFYDIPVHITSKKMVSFLEEHRIDISEDKVTMIKSKGVKGRRFFMEAEIMIDDVEIFKLIVDKLKYPMFGNKQARILPFD